MREASLGLPNGTAVANELDSLYRNDRASEVLSRSRYHNACCEVLLSECFTAAPTMPVRDEAKGFLGKFMSLKLSLINQYEGATSQEALDIARCIDAITPVHLNERVEEIIIQEQQAGNKADLDALKSIAPILQEASRIWNGHSL